MAEGCCNLVGNFIGAPNRTISLSTSSSTETTKIDDQILVGPTTYTLSLSSYASSVVHYGCPARAGVSINWIQKYDCDNNIVRVLFAGAGKSFKYGPIDDYIALTTPVKTYDIVSASAASGPNTLYTLISQTDGYGLSYIGDPSSFVTNDEEGCVFNNLVDNYAVLYLQNFSLELNAGTLPVANFSFLYLPN